jgi:hypothetical protein
MSLERVKKGVVRVQCLDSQGRPVTYRVPRACRRTVCPDVQVSALVDLVRGVFEGPPLERVDAMGALTTIQRQFLFPAQCRCGADHSKFAANLSRAFLWLSQEVRELVAAAELNMVEVIALAAVQRDSPQETARAQVAAARAKIFGGRPADAIPDESIDESESGPQVSAA